jgi:hypothetical protein
MKKLRFNDFLVVRTIESYVQYRNDLWWSDFDYAIFQKSATREIMIAMHQYNCLQSRDAMRMLYQPYEENDKKCMLI